MFKESGISREKVLTRGQLQVKPFYNQLAEQARLPAGPQHVGGRRRWRGRTPGLPGGGRGEMGDRTPRVRGGGQGEGVGGERGPHPRAAECRAGGGGRDGGPALPAPSPPWKGQRGGGAGGASSRPRVWSFARRDESSRRIPSPPERLRPPFPGPSSGRSSGWEPGERLVGSLLRRLRLINAVSFHKKPKPKEQVLGRGASPGLTQALPAVVASLRPQQTLLGRSTGAWGRHVLRPPPPIGVEE